MKRCVITGGTGLIGRNVGEKLLDAGWECYNLSRSSRGIEHDNWKQVLWDFNSVNPIGEILPDSADAVIHLAQSEHFREFPEKAADVLNVNTNSTLKLLEYARAAGVQNFILASSGGIYGHGDEGFKEDQPIIGTGELGFYLGTKLCSEVLAENYVPYMNVIILRFFFVYGPGQRTSMLIPRLINSVTNKIPIILQGEHGIKINPTYVTDAANAVVSALDLQESQKINVAGPEVLTLRQVGEIIGKTVGKEPVFEINESLPRNVIGDISKMTDYLGKPEVGFIEGIGQMLSK